MHGRRSRNRGAVLAGILMISLLVLACAFLALSSAEKVFDTLNWQTMLLKRENVAAQAMSMAKIWFIDQAENGSIISHEEFDPAAQPKSDPYVHLPCGLLGGMLSLNKDIDIIVEIIDMNYSETFRSEADKIGIPFGSPVECLIQKEEGSGALFFKYYCIRVSASFHHTPNNALVFTKNIIAVKDTDNEIHIVPLYTEKTTVIT